MSTAALELETGDENTGQISAVISASAEVAFAVFSDFDDTPRWLSAAVTARCIGVDAMARPNEVAFVGRFERGLVSYVLAYTYGPEAFEIRWQTIRGAAGLEFSGRAVFTALAPTACILTYELRCQMPPLVGWAHPSYVGHAASAVVAEFREHLRRLC